MNWKFWLKKKPKQDHPAKPINMDWSLVHWSPVDKTKAEPLKSCMGCCHIGECKQYYSNCTLYLRAYSEVAENKATCPNCGSKDTFMTYSARFECKKCKKIFS